MKNVKNWSDTLKNLTMLTQLGLSLVAPLLLCLAGCWYLTSRMGLGLWVYIPGFFFGLGGSGMTAYKLYLSVTGNEKKTGKNEKASFNRHI